jgi:hypothetical protein
MSTTLDPDKATKAKLVLMQLIPKMDAIVTLYGQPSETELAFWHLVLQFLTKVHEENGGTLNDEEEIYLTTRIFNIFSSHIVQ